MKVEIYGSAESHTVRGATVNFNADSAAPVTEFVAEVNPNGFDGRTGVDINKNGTTQSVAFGKTCYGGSANVTTGTLTEEYGGGAYDPQNVPAEVKSEVESKLTLETATPGDIVSFDCELGEYPLNSLSFPLAPIQDLHGYDSPWPAGGGKNIVNIADSTTPITAQTTIVEHLSLPAGTYILSSDLNNAGAGSFSMNFHARPGGASVGLSGVTSADGWVRRASNPFTLSEETDGYIYCSGSVAGYAGSYKNIMICKSTETDPSVFAPYENLCPISGWDSVEVERTGVNLLDISTAEVGTAWNGAANTARARLVIPIKRNTQYILTMNGTNSLDGVFSALSTTVPPSGIGGRTFPYSFNSGENDYLVLGFNKDAISQSDLEALNLQLEPGSTASSYHPYAGNRYTITLGQTVYGGTLDVTTGTLTVDRAMVDLGSFDYYWQQHNLRFVSTAEFPGAKYPPNDLTPFVGVCSAMPVIAASKTVGTGVSLGIAFAPNDSLARIRYPGITDATAFKAAMSGVQLVYELATPATYQLTPTEIETLLGQNNVWCDAGEISELKYYDGDITDTDIQTENGVLVTGDKLFYALSSPRTSSFTPTAVNTVQGENTMSANTGNIAVTYTSNWFDITPWIAWQGLTFSRNDVDAPNAGRDMSGYMHRGRVASKEKMNIQTIQLTRAQSSKLQTLLYPETVMVRVTPYPRTNAAQILNMYSNNVKTTYVIHRENGEDLQSLSFPLIEN